MCIGLPASARTQCATAKEEAPVSFLICGRCRHPGSPGGWGVGGRVQPCSVAYNPACALDAAKSAEQPHVASEGL